MIAKQLFAWTFHGPWWHWPVAYGFGYIVFVTLAIALWGFVYRPAATLGHNHPMEKGKPWTAEEVVVFAMFQGLLWPLMLPVYTVFTAIQTLKAIAIGTLDGGGTLATHIAKMVPDHRPHGLQLKSRK